MTEMAIKLEYVPKGCIIATNPPLIRDSDKWVILDSEEGRRVLKEVTQELQDRNLELF